MTGDDFGMLCLKIVGIFILLLVVYSMVVIVDCIIYNPYRRETANNICLNRGYDTYLSPNGYGRILFDKKPYGVICINYNSLNKETNVKVKVS